MEENRFLRAYQEHKKEKEQEQKQIAQNYNNRFECLRENRLPIRESAGRFECLRNTPASEKDIRIENRDGNNRFSCLVDNDYRSHRAPERVTYLPRLEPRESVNSQVRRIKEERKPIIPKLSFESEYHFPDLIKSNDGNSNPKSEVKLKNEMIVNHIFVPDKRETITMLCFRNGKVVSKDIYDDGADILKEGMGVIKKPTYTSWASVIKKDTNEIL
jgi:hypothetical protein